MLAPGRRAAATGSRLPAQRHPVNGAVVARRELIRGSGRSREKGRIPWSAQRPWPNVLPPGPQCPLFLSGLMVYTLLLTEAAEGMAGPAFRQVVESSSSLLSPVVQAPGLPAYHSLCLSWLGEGFQRDREDVHMGFKRPSRDSQWRRERHPWTACIWVSERPRW